MKKSNLKKAISLALVVAFMMSILAPLSVFAEDSAPAEVKYTFTKIATGTGAEEKVTGAKLTAIEVPAATPDALTEIAIPATADFAAGESEEPAVSDVPVTEVAELTATGDGLAGIKTLVVPSSVKVYGALTLTGATLDTVYFYGATTDKTIDNSTFGSAKVYAVPSAVKDESADAINKFANDDVYVTADWIYSNAHKDAVAAVEQTPAKDEVNDVTLELYTGAVGTTIDFPSTAKVTGGVLTPAEGTQPAPVADMDGKVVAISDFALGAYDVVPEGEGAVAYKEAVTAVTLPESLTAINKDLFKGYKALATIEIPATVTEIGAGAFNGCAALTGTFKIGKNIETIGSGAFADTKYTELIAYTVAQFDLSDIGFDGVDVENKLKAYGNFTNGGTNTTVLTYDLIDGDYAYLETKTDDPKEAKLVLILDKDATRLEMPDTISDGNPTVPVEHKITAMDKTVFDLNGDVTKVDHVRLGANMAQAGVPDDTFAAAVNVKTVVTQSKVDLKTSGLSADAKYYKPASLADAGTTPNDKAYEAVAYAKLTKVEAVLDAITVEEGETTTITGKYEPVDASGVTWEYTASNDNAVVTTENNVGTITASKPGKVVITATAIQAGERYTVTGEEFEITITAKAAEPVKNPKKATKLKIKQIKKKGKRTNKVKLTWKHSEKGVTFTVVKSKNAKKPKNNKWQTLKKGLKKKTLTTGKKIKKGKKYMFGVKAVKKVGGKPFESAYTTKAFKVKK